ncbi:MAG: hypothetical protein JSW59_03775 [Phycisphaerales bacterium]|nr:MAG: hypothetical protein JSW59_03775 [Phycisphaerales bacterium]
MATRARTPYGKTRKRRVPSGTRDSPVSKRQIESHKRSAFSGWPMIIGWLAMLVFTIHACTHMVAAGDTWVAMACGRHFVNHGVDTVEPFSANSHKAGPTRAEIETWPGWARWITDKVGIKTVRRWHPTGWINQNWLTHVIYYWLVPKSSYADGVSFTSNALVYWKFAIYIVTVICVYYTGRLLGANPALCAVFCCFAMFTGRSFLDIRPAGFSNMLVAVFLLVLALATYRNILFIWLIVPVTVFWCNVHGGYIYVFIMLVPFTGLNLLTSFSKNRFRSIGLKGVYHTIGAGLAAFVASIVFNPFHLTNLTHTYVISVSKHAERWRQIHEWHSAFDWNNPVGTGVPFLVMFILALAVFVLWIVVLAVARRSVGRIRKGSGENGNGYRWPKVDLPLMTIAALTIYMAIRSRRFIPIASIAGCPIMAMLVGQIIRSISAARNFRRRRRLVVSVMPRSLQLGFTVAGAMAVLFFGTWWGLKFKRIYLDAWPADPKLSSIFMRMTASDAKPFYALKFIKDNKLEGNMLNYWTEGGFVAWGQQPDPNTGRTPLRLFMDGRAQAAYDRKAFDNWSYIMAGGRVTHQILERIRYKGGSVTAADYQRIGEWMDEQLKAEENEVWIVLMPAVVFGSRDKASYHTVKALERHPDWRLVFLNSRQKLLVDVRTPQGKKLFEGIFTGQTVYPDEYHENLIRAYCWRMQRRDANERKRGLDYAIKAFDANPSPVPLLEVLAFARFHELRRKVDRLCEDYSNQYAENQDDWSKQDGYSLRTQAVRIACGHLKGAARGRRNTKLVSLYTSREQMYADTLSEISRNSW